MRKSKGGKLLSRKLEHDCLRVRFNTKVIFTSKTENPMWKFLARRLFLLSGFCMRDTSMFFLLCLVSLSLGILSILTRYCGLVQKDSRRHRSKQLAGYFIAQLIWSLRKIRVSFSQNTSLDTTNWFWLCYCYCGLICSKKKEKNLLQKCRQYHGYLCSLQQWSLQPIGLHGTWFSSGMKSCHQESQETSSKYPDHCRTYRNHRMSSC